MISSSVIKFLLIPGIHPSGGGWQMGGWVSGCVWVWWEVSHAHTHAHTCTHMHACMHMHVEHDKHGCLHVGGHLQFLYMYTCVCVCMCMHVCVCGTPPMPPNAPRHPPPTYPVPRAAGSPKDQNSISLELIEIFRFCLKILYLWTVLNSYRL